MSFYQVFDFLRDLRDNNHKEWMDQHRDEYEAVRDYVIEWIDRLNESLASADDAYRPVAGKRAISRINNNLLYHPNKPTYKDHFGVELNISGGKSGFYLQISLSNNLVGGGMYKPKKEDLDKIRQAIDYDGEKLKKITANPSFKKTFGELHSKHALKTAPKGYSRDHEHIDLLRLKSFAVMHPTTQKQIAGDGFIEDVTGLYKELMPFGQYLNKAVSV
ncbi:MAG: DUF2461 domain-containing protein [Cyclobacteriaceae bacterium]